MKYDVNTQELITRIGNRNWIALSKAITIVENNLEGKSELMDYAFRTASEDSLVLGITGAGGAGKSTLIDGLLLSFTNMGKRIGILAVDPSSSYTGGAVLGDRIRIRSKHSINQNIFFRSFASRGSLGGISQGAKDALYLYKSFGFDIIILESYGVGQGETDITDFVDVTAVVMAPGNGDYIQLAKAGTKEIADIFVVNKADSPDAEALYQALIQTLFMLPEDHRPKVVKTIAKNHKGTEELAELLITEANNFLSKRETKNRLRITNEVCTNALQFFEPMLMKEASPLIEDVLSGVLSPYTAARLLGEKISLKERSN